jgi:hypothetical protein
MGAKTAQSYYRKNSVSALARDLILEYPVLISADIPYDQAIILSKALELQYASLQIMVLSADTAFGVDPMSNAGVRDLISKYHSNNDTPNMVNYAGNMIYTVGSTLSLLAESVDENAEIKLKNVNVIEKAHSQEFLESLWDTPLAAVETSTLNDLYNPSNALIGTVSAVADNLEYAAEAKRITFKSRKQKDTTFDDPTDDDATKLAKMMYASGAFNNSNNKNNKGKNQSDGWDALTAPQGKSSFKIDPKTGDVSLIPSKNNAKTWTSSKSVSNNNNNSNASDSDTTVGDRNYDAPDPNVVEKMAALTSPAGSFDPRKLGDGKRYIGDKQLTPNGARMLKDFSRDYSKLEPTMLELEFFVVNGDNSGMRKAVIGVSTMPRAIPADVMRANLIKALQHDNTGFKFIAWTRGEQKIVRDFMFNVTNIKEDAMAKNRYDKWFAALRKRKRNAKAFKGSRMAINPLTSVIITKNDAALIKQTSGYDLMDEAVATKLMDSLYLLCFMVVDTDTGMVSTLLDGQRYYTETTVKHLEKSNKDKGNDLTNVREMLKLLGR